MKTLYLDCFAGISGDMTLGAFIDLGVDGEYLIKELEKLKVGGYHIHISRKAKNGIMGTDVDVVLEHEHTHESEHHHSHEHTHESEHQHEHHHRSYRDIKKLIDTSELNENVKTLSQKIFHYVAKAEAKIHGKSIDEVHFHEVGAIDSIVDIIGTAICFDYLKVEKVVASPLHTGTGTIKCQHGIIPIPAPATLEILREAKIPFYSTGIKKELVTPTGAAIIAGLVDVFEELGECEVEAVGYGCGKRDMPVVNMLRMMLVTSKKKQ